MSTKSVFPLIVMGAVASACSSPSASTTSHASPSPAVATPALTVLTRSVHPLARSEFDQGRRNAVIPSAGSLYFKPSAQQQADRDALVAAVQNPTSPSYHKWLGADDYAARFGARPADIERVTAWLQSQGLIVDPPSRIGTRVGFRGTTGQVESAFHTEIHNYLVAGKPHFAMASAPSIPSELAPVVLGLHGFHDFHPHAPKHARKPQYKDPQYGLTLAPSDFWTLYDTKPLYAATPKITGTGVNLVIVGQTYYAPTDISSFRTEMETGYTVVLKDVLVPGTGASAVNDPDDEGETELDLEWSGATAPGANIVFVYTGNDTNDYSVDDAAAYAIEMGDQLIPGTGNGGAQIISESYGGCEYGEPAEADVEGEIAAAANLEGITYLAAAGDSGAAGCLEFGIGGLYTGPPASMPGVTAVGGSEFPATTAQVSPFFVNDEAKEYPQSSATPPVSYETPWNDSTAPAIPVNQNQEGAAAGGGGVSILFPKPLYQVGMTPNDGARDVPDVSLTASADEVGYEVYEMGSLGPIGGTSAATPSFAGIIALVNQAVAAKGGALGLGNINPALYGLYKSAPTAFHDIVTGDNKIPCTAASDPPPCTGGTYGGYSAGVGYDMASGLGSVDANVLVTAWTALTPTTTSMVASTTATTVGTQISLTATIASTATTNAMGGTVTFTFETSAGAVGPVYAQDAGGGFDESWILGTVPVTAGSGSPEGATATIDTAIPPGLYGSANVVAMYNGDTHYLGSQSKTAVPITVTGSTLAVTPSSIALKPNQQTTLTATGGVPPIWWSQVGVDTTCLITGSGATEAETCSEYESLNGTTAAFQAGGQAGAITVLAIDTQGQEATVKITVSGTAIDGGTLPTVDDAGPSGGPVAAPPLEEAGVVLSGSGGEDSGIPLEDGGIPAAGGDASPGGGGGGNGATGPSSSGCSCGVAGSQGSNEGALGALLLGLVAVGRRRRR